VPFVVSLLVLLFVSFPSLGWAGETQYSAMVTAVEGDVSVWHLGAKRKIDLGHLLYPGDEVETRGNASLIIYYLESGLEEQWLGNVKFVAEKIASKPAAMRAKKKDRINLPQIEPQQMGGIRLKQMGGIRLRGPQRTQPTINVLSNTFILEDTPIFRWNPIDFADRYIVTLYPFGQNKSLWQRTTKVAEMAFPPDENPLTFGSRYEWEVEAFLQGEVIDKTKRCFALPTKEESDSIQKVIDSYQTELSINPSNTNRRFDLIFFLDKHRLYYNALDQYQELQRIQGKSESLSDREGILIGIENSSPCQF